MSKQAQKEALQEARKIASASISKPRPYIPGRIEPSIDSNGVPWCDEKCPSHDGKRCMKTGFCPDNICEPAVIEMAKLLKEKNAD